MNPIEMTDKRYNLKFDGETIFIVGDIDVANSKDVLGGFLKLVHKQMIKDKLHHIVVDVQQLGFINSTAIKEITTWVMMSELLDDDQKYMIKFLLKPGVHWQKLTFTAIKWLNEKYIEVVI